MIKGNLLIVDDEPILLKMLKMSLEELADNVYTACDGVEALSVIKSNLIHCIVSDVNMPRMSGLELIKKLREDNRSIPFIFYTGHGNQEMMLEVANFGAFDFFDKPNIDGLEESITSALNLGMTGTADAKDESIIKRDYQAILAKLSK